MEKKKIMIFGYSINRILAYFLIYSVIGCILEMIFAFIMYGTLESRQGMLVLPMIPLYGVGGVILVLCLNKVRKNWLKVFIGGILIGSLIEYTISFLGETFLHVRWWDYSNNFLNLNGRICMQYSIYWGLISIYLIKSLNPLVDKLIYWIKRKINVNFLAPLTYAAVIFVIVNMFVSTKAEEILLSKTIVENNIDAKNRTKYEQIYDRYYQKGNSKFFVKYFCNENLLIKTYPNLRITMEDDSLVYAKDYYPNIVPYFFKYK